jgi:chromosome segregation ATPase
MTIVTAIPDGGTVREAFRQWRAAHEPLAGELRESLSALAAFQSHLDAWQQQLVRQREELAATRQQLASEHAEAARLHTQADAEKAAELNALREKVASLTGALLARTDELRVLDGRRGELVTELELARAREKDFVAKLEELKQSREEERRQSADEMRHLRELLERRLEASDAPRPTAPADQPPSDRPPAARPAAEHPPRDANSPVLGSIVEQFGKLRQQRALDRPVHKAR